MAMFALRSLSAVHRSLSRSPAPSSQLHSRTFRSTAASLLAQGSCSRNLDGRDYNHWLIRMDFPEDPRPTAVGMVQIYEETCAKGLNISFVKAMKRIYAVEVHPYPGFHAVMTEAESDQFRGDKYEDGMIYPRPPSGSYGPGGQGEGQGACPNCGQSYMGQGEGQIFPQGEQRNNMQGDQGGYGPGGTNQNGLRKDLGLIPGCFGPPWSVLSSTEHHWSNCNHWLITVRFPRDPEPTPVEMVQTYEEICAKGLNISVEEATKRMYACSTTTYRGFQAAMTAAESQ